MKMLSSATLLAGLTAALGTYLACCGAGSIRWAGIALLLASLATLLLNIMEAKRLKRELESLHGQIIDFLEGRETSPRFSVDDDDFALLENAVVELESRLLLEQEKARRESQKNAEFIADVSHQLKTPLAALKLYCEMEQTQDPGKDLSRQLLLIERMENLIFSLLRLEKLRADAYEMRFAEHDLGDLARQVWSELQPLYPGKRFQLEGGAAMRCDAYWLGEALRNILKNSCEHTPPEGQVNLFIEETERSITVTVEDNGGGIPEEELPGLFRRFYRSSRARPDGGVGLGLAIARTIVEKHHGIVSAENTSRGLQIALCFPRLEGIRKGG
ncbi:MAG TPA: HAMP domain-containing sensor histidine kinase [Bacillota bacterium]|nr:HAMP domain-containing histidine kinase [Bacillota bacterium]HOA35736.1 HAMP domain-containing sensor histidine kinase [Bacillota bacterium]HOJ84756.1 HAMP domain-containing sensor histidine kinase [Bacillota bacterium]HOL15471.1 HAMP domain-containing sensor histidine kinase [Bacillota bacterium]HPZ11786.1 HAMP domain-containing sensor histidine kinase [Bacillota bacterium]